MGAIHLPSVNFWWITASQRDPGHAFHWKTFFENPADPARRIDWGGPEWIRSSVSYVRIRKMRRGNVVVAYQAVEGLRGLLYLASDGYQHTPGGHYDTFDLSTSPQVYLDCPVPYEIIQMQPDARDNIEFVRVKRGSVFAITPHGFQILLNLMIGFNYSLIHEIEAFFEQS